MVSLAGFMEKGGGRLETQDKAPAGLGRHAQGFHKLLLFCFKVPDITRPVGRIAEWDRWRARVVRVFLAPYRAIQGDFPAAILAEKGKHFRFNHGREGPAWVAGQHQSTFPAPAPGA